jgi:hypothetical protein
MLDPCTLESKCVICRGDAEQGLLSATTIDRPPASARTSRRCPTNSLPPTNICGPQVTQQAFPNGIAWTTVGKEATHDLVSRMQEVRPALGDGPNANETELHCINCYRNLLREKAALVIVDDVWKTKDVEPFLADSPRSWVLFTTRDASVAAAVGAKEHQANLLTEPQSRALLARWSGYQVDHLRLSNQRRWCAGTDRAFACSGTS